MNGRPEKAKVTVSIPIKNENIFRRQAFNSRLELSELFVQYQEAYLKALEKEKAEKKAEKENKKCESCGQLVINAVKSN